MKSPLAILCIVGSCVSLQLGAALAVQLFPAAGSWGTAALRLLIASVVLLAIARPRLRSWTPEQWRAVVLFGLSMGAMNGCFYTALSHLPLGSAVTIEFIGPLALAAVLSCSVRDAICVALALAGLALLGWGSLHNDPLPAIGVGFVLAAAAFWACYILASKHAGRLVPGQGGLAMALAIGGLVLLPFGWRGAGIILADSHLLSLAVGTGLLASLIPYSLELIALRRIEPNVFSILISLEPVFAVFFGWLLISEHVGPLKVLAVCLVVSASVLQTLGASRGGSGGVRLRRVARAARSRVSP